MLATLPSQLDTGAVKPHREADKQLLRELIQRAGLRFSIPRLKIMAALYASATGPAEQAGITGAELHQQLNDAGEPLCVASVRDVLRRLERNGLVLCLGRDRYCLAPTVETALHTGNADALMTTRANAAPAASPR